tara:strand:+ start:585 stop:998 length:414 start_codon:yes stop_codon:yes gene_type:complete
MIFTILAAVSTAVGTYGAVQAGKSAENAAKEQARQEKIAAESRELARKEELGAQLAADIAAQAASGIGTEGTRASISLASAKSIGQSEGMISLSERLAQSQTIRGGKAAKAQAYGQAASTLLKGGKQTAEAYKTEFG